MSNCNFCCTGSSTTTITTAQSFTHFPCLFCCLYFKTVLNQIFEMQGKANNYVKWTKLGNILIWEREKNVTKRWQKWFVDEKMKRTLLQSELFLLRTEHWFVQIFFSISPKITFQYNSISLGKDIFNPKPALKILNAYRAKHLLRQGLAFICNAAGNVEVALLQVRAKFSASSQDLLAPQQGDGNSSLSWNCRAIYKFVMFSQMDTGYSSPSSLGTWSPSPLRPAPCRASGEGQHSTQGCQVSSGLCIPFRYLCNPRAEV